jgi:hypothetical protein
MHRFLILLLPFLALAAQPTPATCGPLLNEVMADPATDWDGDGTYSYRNDEWVEIVNPGPDALDLGGYYLTDEAGGQVFGLSGMLNAGDVLLVTGAQSVAWESAHGETATGLRLGNDGDTVQLVQVVDGAPVIVDSYTYNTYEAEDDRSSGRNPDGTGPWVLFDARNPYSGSTVPLGTGLAPTPGLRNDGGSVDPPATPAEEATWGEVKALYSGSR